jgi:hypothetical protein
MCIHTCFSPLLLKPVVQKLEERWNSLTKSVRLALVLDHLPMECGVS